MVRVAKFAYVGLSQTYSSSKTTGMGKTHGNGKNWFSPGKMEKTGKIAFFQNTCLKSIQTHELFSAHLT
jgi:hypothetical protein